MIIDSIKHIRDYESLLPGIRAGMDVVERAGALEVGRHDFEGGYLMVQEGTTTPLDEGTFEAHRAYADVQIILAGSEEVAWAERDGLAVVVDYDPAKDAERLDGPRDHRMLIGEGMFWIALPHDAHRPCAHTGEARSYRKIVMKLPVGY
ncbi:MAG: YhcH/YjgK/YiaL family protein [Acidobacteriota bacterium]|nr:YhcH/YjgK/YiaL family protein [Acidobacteriota bacterium]